MKLNAILERFEHCDCGKEHSSGLKCYEMYPGALANMGSILRGTGFARNIHVVADRNTLAVCEGLVGSLEGSGYAIHMTLFEDMRLADMESVDRIAAEGKDADGFLAVGTGSLNDITKHASFKRGVPYAVFATAPSMDGFASTVAALVEDGLKKSIPSHSPVAIIADSEIIAAAPAMLKSAGYADIIGKYTALLDWRISGMLTGEYYCGRVADAMMEAVDACVGITGEVASSDPRTAEILMDALVLAGMGMQFCGNSRPAAGAEHLVSHFWEMACLREGRPLELHGKKVGIATVMVAGFYHALSRLGSIEFKDYTIDNAGIEAALGSHVAREIVALNTPSLLDGIARATLAARWDEIRGLIHAIPSAGEISSLLLRAGAWTKPSDAQIDETHARQGLSFGCYAHRKLTLLQIAGMIGNLPEEST